MRAAVVRKFGPPSNICIEKSWPIPEINENQVLVKVKAVGVNPYEVHIREGTYPLLPELPYVPGGEGAGDSFSQGAALGVAYITAYRSIFFHGHGAPGQTIFIHGASGGVGIASVQLAHAKGLKVIGTAGTNEGLKLVRENGAEAVFNHREKDYVQKIKEKYPNGFDIILEMLANQNLNTDADLIAKAGRIVIIGSRDMCNFDARKIMSKEASITGVARLLTTTNEQYLEWGQELTDLWTQHKINPIVGAELPLEKLAEAHELIMNPAKTSAGKIVIKI